MVHVEVSLGVVVVLAAWMLDAAACAGMEIGPPDLVARSSEGAYPSCQPVAAGTRSD